MRLASSFIQKFIDRYGFAPDEKTIIRNALNGVMVQKFHKVRKLDGEEFRALEMRVGKDGFLYKIDRETKKIVTFNDLGKILGGERQWNTQY